MVYKISLKDWERMQDLLDRNQNGEGVAAKIKEVGKAVARFVAGTVLAGETKNVLECRSFYWSPFSAFARKAESLGATKDDIFETLETATVPEGFKDSHVTKKSYTGYVGSLERLIDKLMKDYPVHIERKSINNGYVYWSPETRSGYNRNGRVWPLNYMLTIKCGDKVETHSVIVVTNEGGGNYGYDFDRCRMPWNMIRNRLEQIVKEIVA